MIWESNKIMSIIDKKKWGKLDTIQKKQLIAQVQIWLAIHYFIRLHLSGYSTDKQIHLLQKYYNEAPTAFNSMTLYEVMELYARIRPMIPYFLYLNYVIMNRNQKRCSQRKMLTAGKSNSKKSKTKSKSKKRASGKTKSKKEKQKGGYLFMLTSRGEKPIRGVDMERFLEKVDGSIQDISYLPSSAAGTEDAPAHPFNGFALLYFLARNKLGEGSFYAMPYVSDYLNPFGNGGTYKYSSLLRLWSNLQKESRNTERKKSMEDEYANDYEKFVKKYMGRKEFRTKKDEYKEYLNNVQKYKLKHDLEQKLYEKYSKEHPDTPNPYIKKAQKYLSTLDKISMATSLMPTG